MIDDTQAYRMAHPDDRWVYNKLMLAEHLGYYCGPSGIMPEVDGHYIVRPIMNLEGMGIGARYRYLTRDSDWALVPAGYFWCEDLSRKVLHPGETEEINREVVSLDYDRNGLCIRRTTYTLDPNFAGYRFIRYADGLSYPCHSEPGFETLTGIKLKGKYRTVNVETVNGNVIEVHLRGNPDPIGKYRVLWGNEKPKGNLYDIIEAPEDCDGMLTEPRRGFIRFD